MFLNSFTFPSLFFCLTQFEAMCSKLNRFIVSQLTVIWPLLTSDPYIALHYDTPKIWIIVNSYMKSCRKPLHISLCCVSEETQPRATLLQAKFRIQSPVCHMSLFLNVPAFIVWGGELFDQIFFQVRAHRRCFSQGKRQRGGVLWLHLPLPINKIFGGGVEMRAIKSDTLNFS